MARTTSPVDEQTMRRLVALKGASREAIEATIALWPLSARMHLAVEGIIDSTSSDFSLTDAGMRVIEEESVQQHEVTEPAHRG